MRYASPRLRGLGKIIEGYNSWRNLGVNYAVFSLFFTTNKRINAEGINKKGLASH
jgi:hypothetical protein